MSFPIEAEAVALAQVVHDRLLAASIAGVENATAEEVPACP